MFHVNVFRTVTIKTLFNNKESVNQSLLFVVTFLFKMSISIDRSSTCIKILIKMFNSRKRYENDQSVELSIGEDRTLKCKLTAAGMLARQSRDGTESQRPRTCSLEFECSIARPPMDERK